MISNKICKSASGVQNSGQEDLMVVLDERVREGGIEMTNTTFVAAIVEGLVFHFTYAAHIMLLKQQHPTSFFLI